jgi:hypothetical protein
MYKAYTYLIGWKEKNVWYYGVRYKQGCKLEDLFSTYFTSSKYVHEAMRSWGLPDHIQIRRKFNNIKKALIWEQKVLRRLNIVSDDKNKWLNKNIGGAILFDDEIRKKMSLKKIDKKWVQKNNKKILIDENLLSFYIKEGFSKWIPDVKGNKNPMFGKKHQAKTKEKISKSKIGKTTISIKERKIKSDYLKTHNPMFDDSIKEKHRINMKIKNEINRKYPIKDHKIYLSIDDASEKTGISRSTISWKCRNEKDGWKYSRP